MKTVGKRHPPTTPAECTLVPCSWKESAVLTPQDLVENVVVKVADEVEVDVSTRAWKISYADAIPTALRTVIEGVEIPYLDLAILIASKDTDRDQDRVDVQILREIARRHLPRPDSSKDSFR